MTTDKTKLQWLVDGNLIYRLNKNGSNEISLSVAMYPRDQKKENILACLVAKRLQSITVKINKKGRKQNAQSCKS